MEGGERKRVGKRDDGGREGEREVMEGGKERQWRGEHDRNNEGRKEREGREKREGRKRGERNKME